MVTKEIESKWNLLTPEPGSSYRSLRLSSECIPDLFIGVDQDSKRSLILKLPANYRMDFRSNEKQNLSLTFYNDTRWVVLKLLDNNYCDLFNDLIISFYNRIYHISDVSGYSKEIIHTFYKWSEFFDDPRRDKLGEETIKGLWGELRILLDLIGISDSNSINELLGSWRGPYDSGHDFIMSSKNLEVKTKDTSKTEIRISSEFQLEPEFEKDLELVVVNVEPDQISGLSVKDLILRVKEVIIDKLGDFTILLKAIAQKGLNMKNIEEYDGYKYRAINATYYNSTYTGFPRIIRAEIPNEITRVSYNLNVNSLKDFLISNIDY
jgi:hypothetical protein